MGDEEILQALAMLTKAVKSRMEQGPQDDLAGMDADSSDNGPKGWSGIQIARGPDDRPSLSDQDYVIQKLALGEGDEVPHDSSGGSMVRPF